MSAADAEQREGLAPAPGFTMLPGAAGAPVCEGDVCYFPGAEATPAE